MTRALLIPLLLWTLSTARAAEWGEEGRPWPGEREAAELVEVLRDDPDGTKLARPLADLRRRPGNLDSMAELKGAVVGIYLNRLESGRGAEKAADLCFRFLIRQLDIGAAQAICREGQSAFHERFYLLAADRLMLCRALAPRQDWLNLALDLYLQRLIPKALAAGGEEEQAPCRLSVHRALAASRWDAAFRETQRCRKLSRAREREELGILADRLRARGSAGGPQALEEALRLARAEPERGVAGLEALLHRNLKSADEPWWRRGAEALALAYARRDFGRMLGEARENLRAGRREEAYRLALEVLQRDPENRQAMALRKELEGRREVRGEERGELRGSSEGWWDKASAEASYNHGLKAYLQGDLRAAISDWRQALRFDAEHEKSSKALARALKELEASGNAEKPPATGTDRR